MSKVVGGWGRVAEIVQHCKTTLRRPISIFKNYFGSLQTTTRLSHLFFFFFLAGEGRWQLHGGHYLDFCQFIINTENVKLRFKWEFRNLLHWIQSHPGHQNVTNIWNHVWFPNSTGGVAGQRLSEHPDIRKLGFTGSTPIGKQIMRRYWFQYVCLL